MSPLRSKTIRNFVGELKITEKKIYKYIIFNKI